MSNHSQEDELREKIQDYAIDFHNSYRPNYPTPDLDALMQIITADRKRVALEARIDELNVVLPKTLKYEVTHTQANNVTRRLDELEAELKSKQTKEKE